MIGRVTDQTGEPAKTSKLAEFRDRYAWLDHLVRAAARYTERHGDHYAAAITYFSVLALVPLLMVAFAIVSFVLRARPDLLDQLKVEIAAAVPQGLADTVNRIVDQALGSATAVGVIGLLGALYAGLGWMTNLREALTEQWGRQPQKPPFLRRMLVDLLALVGLGAALVVSLGITIVGSGFASQVLKLLGLADNSVAQFLLGALAVVLGVVANWLVFMWVIAKLPRVPVSWRSAAKAAALGAVGFEVLKQLLTLFIGRLTDTPTGALFGPIIALLIFIFLVSRLLLFVTAWAATAPENEQPDPPPAPPPAVIRQEVVVRPGPDPRAAAGLVGAGALAGLVGGRLLNRRRG
jgi:membrane protein